MWQTGQRVQGVGTYVAEGLEMELKVSGEVVVEIRAHQARVAAFSTGGTVVICDRGKIHVLGVRDT